MLRLTGGEFRGRLIRTPANLRTRPTQARLRQALFNSVQARVPEARVLDLFAGSGALGFEALSRGANQVTFVESARGPLELIQRNAQELKVENRIEVFGEPVERYWKRGSPESFSLILADPPYAGGWELRLLEEFPWHERLKPDGLFCLEWGTQKSQVAELPESLPWLVKIREKNYGDSVLTTYQRKEDGSP